ncbi:MAG: hypothetical protein HF308_18955 [Ignavibacteria bacterium]|jgi:hypothetical protein|nr:hypothetical protein [Ignavibacteria bacterium]
MVEKSTPFTGGHSLRYSWDNMELMCDALGLDTLQDFADFFKNQNFGLRHLKTMIWAGLQREDQPFAIRDVGPLIDEFFEDHDFNELLESVMSAITNSWVGKQGEATGEPQKKPPKPSKN